MEEELKALSDAERDALKVLWDHGAGTVREVQEILNAEDRNWAYTTMKTILNRLAAKGYARREQSGKALVYHPAITREGLVRRRLRELQEDLCNGVGSPIVRALVGSVRLSPEEIGDLRASLDEMEKRGEP